MTIDECIKHCEEVADKYCEKVEEGLTADSFCDRCASEHRQFAEWLKDVKEVFKNCNTCKYESLPPDDYPCDRCSHRYINQYVYDDKWEVNADG